jgi:hypothetical protein
MANRPAMALPERFERALGVNLTDVSSTGAGQGRSCFARLAGQDVVVKWGLDPDLVEKIPYIAGQVQPLRDRDCQIPRILAHGLIGSGAAGGGAGGGGAGGGGAGGGGWLGYGWVEERLPGVAATVLDDMLLADLLALITRLAGAPPGTHRNDLGAWVPAVVFDDDAGWWRNACAIGPDVAAFCQRLRGWIGRPSLAHYPAFGSGYVHCDLNLSNILVRDNPAGVPGVVPRASTVRDNPAGASTVRGGRLSGLVDVEHMGIGDRGIDVARLAAEWYKQATEGVMGLARDGLARLVEFGLEVSGPDGWRVAVGYELISRLGWCSGAAAAPPAPADLPLCEAFLDAIPS